MYGGTVISITTRERARCELAESDEIVLSAGGRTARIYRNADLELNGDELDIARAALTYFGIRPGEHGFSLALSTEVPMQAGMAGSTALVVATVGGLDRYLGLNLHPWALSETARRIENQVMGVLCGFQDQQMAVFGGVNYMDFAQKEDLVQREDEPLATVEPLAPYLAPIPLIAAHTGIRHHSGAVHQSPRDRWLAGDREVLEAVRRISQIARSGKRALLAGDWIALGRLMNENHSIVRGWGGSGPQNEQLIAAARAAGAHGAKLAGAGGGGTILALGANLDKLESALREAGAETFVYPAPSPGLSVQGSIAARTCAPPAP
jgi:galactokinase/mevalonate kinase-like predicted kinase